MDVQRQMMSGYFGITEITPIGMMFIDGSSLLVQVVEKLFWSPKRGKFQMRPRNHTAQHHRYRKIMVQQDGRTVNFPTLLKFPKTSTVCFGQQFNGCKWGSEVVKFSGVAQGWSPKKPNGKCGY
ncbi:MAG: hypothetical protein CM15mP65_18090 [Crocinitomicaceae bacterium]|nr:MAG: hypothetical protein CM15mP65_18090 [Crocinitomicaceae bacterium]